MEPSYTQKWNIPPIVYLLMKVGWTYIIAYMENIETNFSRANESMSLRIMQSRIVRSTKDADIGRVPESETHDFVLFAKS